MSPFDIYFADLNQSTQEAYLEFTGLKSAREANLDVFPLTTLEAPEPELAELRLYSPITIDVSIPNGDVGLDCVTEEFTLSGRETVEYENLVRDALESEMDSEMERRGLMEYFYGLPSVNEKVQYAYPTAEVFRDELWCVTECRIREPLSPAELDAFKDYLTGQFSDGFGEGFEQREQEIMGGIGYIHLWQGDGRFFIRTEQELKGIPVPAKHAPAKAKPRRSRDAR